MKNLVVKFGSLFAPIDTFLYNLTPKKFLNFVFYAVMTIFVASCTSNAEGYYSAQAKTDSTELSKVPAIETPTYEKPASPSLSLAHSDTVRIKPVQQLANEVKENAANAVGQIVEKTQTTVLTQTGSEIEEPDTAKVVKVEKLKSPAIPIYNCQCVDKKIIEKGTTPTGIVAYYKGKYKNLTINELKRINKPGMLDPSRFRAGSAICLKRKCQ